ncbi:MAG: 5-formyltetrahydrofolate cyclo-ligase, partial [uncultured Sphingomonas sp.]
GGPVTLPLPQGRTPRPTARTTARLCGEPCAGDPHGAGTGAGRGARSTAVRGVHRRRLLPDEGRGERLACAGARPRHRQGNGPALLRRPRQPHDLSQWRTGRSRAVGHPAACRRYAGGLPRPATHPPHRHRPRRQPHRPGQRPLRPRPPGPAGRGRPAGGRGLAVPAIVRAARPRPVGRAAARLRFSRRAAGVPRV